jgi:hypothetical protein
LATTLSSSTAAFQFREDDTPGIDYILPNTKYLEDRKDKIRGDVYHARPPRPHRRHPLRHRPHRLPAVYTRRAHSVMIRKRQEEFPNLKPLDIHEVEKEDTVRVGNLRVRFFLGYAHDPRRDGYHYRDALRLWSLPATSSSTTSTASLPKPKKKSLLTLKTKKFSSWLPTLPTREAGFSIPERTVQKTWTTSSPTRQGRLIIGTFSSQLERIMRMSSSRARRPQSAC